MDGLAGDDASLGGRYCPTARPSTIKRYVGAVRQQSYAGVYLHPSRRHGGILTGWRTATKAVSGEKRESLDGVRWELVRQGNELTAYMARRARAGRGQAGHPALVSSCCRTARPS